MLEKVNWIEVGIISKPHGIRGELRLIPQRISAERLLACRHWAMDEDKVMRAFTPEKLRLHQNKLIMKMVGVDDRNTAELQRDKILYVAETDLPEPDDDALDLVDIEGFSVLTESGQIVGKVVDLIDLPTQSCLVLDAEGRELLIPWVDEFVHEVDLDEGRIVITPIDGLLDSDEN